MKRHQIKILFIALIGFLVASNAFCKEQSLVSTISVASVNHHVKSNSNNKPLLLLITSTDDSCGPCLQSNKHFQKASQSLKAQYNFSRVVFNPYTDVSEMLGFSEKMKLKGLPWLVIYHNGKQLHSLPGLSDHMKIKGLRKFAIKINKEK